MPDSSKNSFRDYFYFMKNDRNGMILLLGLILMSVVGRIIISNIDITPRFDYSEWMNTMDSLALEKKTITNKNVLFHFNPNEITVGQLDSLDVPLLVKRNLIRYRSAGGQILSAEGMRKIYGMTDSIFNRLEPYLIFPKQVQNSTKEKTVHRKVLPEVAINPNKADKQTLLDYGLNNFQASNIVKYRNNGGRFQTPDDLLKIYGIDSVALEPLKSKLEFDDVIAPDDVILNDTIIHVELNSADSASLVKLKGIGPVFAKRILKYRDLLGGFYSADQLLEVYGFPEETYENLKAYLLADTAMISRIRLNFADYGEMIRHPYLNKDQVKSILDYRQLSGSFTHEEQLIINELIDTVTFSQIRPYITCR